ncbi:MAG: thiamine phosphate synthase [Chthoniobacterales bacterium]
MTSLMNARLYAIVDLNYVVDSDVSSVTAKLLDGGVDVLQLRAKNRPLADVRRFASELRAQTAERGVPLIVNDHPEVAHDIGADGVHVGQDDMSVAEARAEIGAEAVVGKSTHSIAQAIAAASEGADYIGFGPLFSTPTKPDYQPIGLTDIAEVHRRVTIPIFCIGGIKLENLEQVIAFGARRVVIVSGLLTAADIADYARRAKQLLCEA